MASERDQIRGNQRRMGQTQSATRDNRLGNPDNGTLLTCGKTEKRCIRLAAGESVLPEQSKTALACRVAIRRTCHRNDRATPGGAEFRSGREIMTESRRPATCMRLERRGWTIEVHQNRISDRFESTVSKEGRRVPEDDQVSVETEDDGLSMKALLTTYPGGASHAARCNLGVEKGCAYQATGEPVGNVQTGTRQCERHVRYPIN